MSARIQAEDVNSGTRGGLTGSPRLIRSVLFHAGVVVFVTLWIFIANHIHSSTWGNQKNPGAIQATLVSSAAIPLPEDHPPTKNVVATQTPSQAPAPPQPKHIPPPPPPKAVPIAKRVIPPKKHEERKVEHRHKTAPAPPKQYRAAYGEQAATRMPRALAPVQSKTNSPVTVAGGSSGFNYPWYVALIQRTVRQNWYTQEVSPQTPTGAKVTVTFRIARDGSPSDIRILQSSGYSTLDSSAMRAVQRVQDFSPLPSGYNKSNVMVQYTFTYDLNSH